MKNYGANEFLIGLEAVIGREGINSLLSGPGARRIEYELRDHSKLILNIENSNILASRIPKNSDKASFEFCFRVRRQKGKFELWPLTLAQKGQTSINCVSILNGKELVNISRQQELIDIANMWGKNIRAQKTVGNLEGLS